MVRATTDSSEVAERRFELNVRSLAPRTKGGTQERALGLLDRLDEDGTAESITVRVWGERVALSTTAVETDRRREVLDRVGAFRDWANRAGVRLDGLEELGRNSERTDPVAATSSSD